MIFVKQKTKIPFQVLYLDKPKSNMKKVIFLFCLLVASQIILAQSFTVKGIVKGSDVNDVLPGTNITIKGKSEGTISDVDGNFTIKVNKGDILVFSYIGYKSIEKTIKDNATLNIVLEPDNTMLNEVVAIGYGTMKKSDLTGAVSTIKSEELQKTPAASLDQALQGKAAGVTVNANSGQPGTAAEVRIRGIGTVNGSAPIYVVDGVMVNDITFLSPNDIASTEILKDASATAIYGSRGANGVILVTTKKGKSGTSKISFDAYYGFQNRWRKLDLMKSKEFAETLIKIGGVQSELNYYNSKGFDKWLSTYRLGHYSFYPTNLDYSGIETDWQDEVFKKNAPIQNYNISFTGGTDKNSYALSASYFNQDGTIIGSNYERFTIRSNTSYQIHKWIKVGENLSLAYSTGRNAMNNNSSPGASILSAAIAMAPWDPAHYPQGAVNNLGEDLSGRISAASNFKNVTNPFSMVEMTHPNDINERWVGDVYMDLTPIKDLTIHSDISIDLNNNRYRLFKEAYEYSAYDKNADNYLTTSMARTSRIVSENTATYKKELGKHSFSAMIGQTTEQYNYYTLGGSGNDIANASSSTNWYLKETANTEENPRSVSDDVSRTRRFSLLSRLYYNYNQKYMATFNFRADASSRFPNHLWGNFPSLALAWRISEEKWFHVTHLDYMKIRAGWGQIGNDQVAENNSFTQLMFTSGPTFVDYTLGSSQSLVNGATVLTYVNTNGKWETTEQLDAGIDFSLYNGLITGNLDVYNRNTRDMILSVTAPAQVGNRFAPKANVGTVNNKGLELALNYNEHIGKLNYSAGGNVSFVKNELTALNGGSPVYGDVTICNQGKALYTFYGYKYLGIYKTDKEAQDYLWGYSSDEQLYHAGDAKFEDVNGDGKITDADKTDIGNPFPWLTYGLNLSADYHNFDLQLFFQGVYGNQIYNAVRIRTEGTGNTATLSTTMRDVWSNSNPDGNIPNPKSSNNYATSSRFVESGAYLRLKTFQFGYTIPKKITQKAQIDRCRLYISATNLLTLTNYTGYDPEIGGGVDYGNYPQSRTLLFGINLDF